MAHRKFRARLTCVTCVLGIWSAAALAQSDAGFGAGAPAAAASVDSTPLLRVFLTDGEALVSYGEFARVGDTVVFSMPTTASPDAPQLQLVTIPSDRVDWERTLNYADAMRARRYLATRAESDYTALTVEIERTLSEVSDTADPARRLLLVESARRRLAEWPAAHFNYKRDEIQPFLDMLDEIIGNLRAAMGASRFDIALVAPSSAPPAEPALPAPGIKDIIESTLSAAHLTTSPAERLSLLAVALSTIEAERANLPSAWLETTREATRAEIAHEVEIDRQYQALSTRLLKLATTRAARADVSGVQRVLDQIPAGDAELGSTRPDAVASLVAAVEHELDAARRLRLERDRWAIRAPEFRAYRAAMATPIQRLASLSPLLENIKALAGSGPSALGRILQVTALIRKAVATIEPPSEVQAAHELFISAVQLADSAARIRREAAIASSMPRAWDASSAAAGSMMLGARARDEMQAAMRRPQFSR